MSFTINTINGNKVHTSELENMNSDLLLIKDSLDMNNNNITNVNNINLSTINNLPYPPTESNNTTLANLSNISNGKYSQVNGDVIVTGDNTDLANHISIIGGTGFGSLIFSPEELTVGSSYHIKIAGTLQTHKKKKINISIYFDSTKIFETKIETIDSDILIDGLNNNSYAYESEIDFTITNDGLNGSIYSNGQILYVKNSSFNGLRGSSSEYIVNNINLTNNLLLDIRIYWEDSADDSELLTNKMVRITKMF